MESKKIISFYFLKNITITFQNVKKIAEVILGSVVTQNRS